MTHELLARLWAATWIGSAAMALALLLRPPLRRWGGAGVAYAAWAVVPLALLASLPPYPRSDWPTLQWGAMAQVTQVAAAPAPAAAGPMSGPVLAVLWLVGTLASVLLMLHRQWRLRQRLGRLRAGRGPGVFVATAGRVEGPLLVGLLRPKIVLPADFEQRYTPQQQALVLAHEQVHLRRLDLPTQLVAALLQAAFWFNPLVHLAVLRFRQDQELACDEAVLRRHPGQRREYARALLNTHIESAGVLAALAAPLGCRWEGGHPLKHRLQQLSRTAPHPAQRRLAQCALAGLALAACGLAWAAETGAGLKHSAASGAANPEEGRHYSVKLGFTRVPGESTRRRDKEVERFEFRDLPLSPGARLQLLWPEEIRPRMPCDIGLQLKTQSATAVLTSTFIDCGDGVVREPRVLTQLGQDAEVSVIGDRANAPGYRMVLNVTDWPADRPWPAPITASEPLGAGAAQH